MDLIEALQMKLRTWDLLGTNLFDENWRAKNFAASLIEEEVNKNAPKEMTTNPGLHRTLESTLSHHWCLWKVNFSVKLRNHFLMVPYTPHPVLWQVRELRKSWFYLTNLCIQEVGLKAKATQQLLVTLCSTAQTHVKFKQKGQKGSKSKYFQIISRETFR